MTKKTCNIFQTKIVYPWGGLEPPVFDSGKRRHIRWAITASYACIKTTENLLSKAIPATYSKPQYYTNRFAKYLTFHFHRFFLQNETE